MDKVRKHKKAFYVVIFITLLLCVLFVLSLLPNSQEQINLGGHFKYDIEHQYITGHQICSILYPYIIRKQPKRKDIPPKVIDYVNDERFIFVKQKPKIPLEQIYYDDNDIKYPIGVDTVYYWIIDKMEGAVEGPFVYEDYVDRLLFYHKLDSIGFKKRFD